MGKYIKRDRAAIRRRAKWAVRLSVLGIVMLLTALAAFSVRVSRFSGRQPANVLASLDVAPDTVKDWTHVIAYVPLDDRTDNVEDAVYLAEASGWRVVMPEQDLYRTALDGQPLNANGTQYGNRAALLEWVRAMSEKGCRRYVLSLDQLFSGGLVNSRSISASWPIIFPDGSSLSEAAAFDAYILPLAENPENRVYLFDSVTRLSPTVGYRGVGEAEYYALRAYGMVERPALPEENLTLENVFALYPYAANGVTKAEEEIEDGRFRSVITEELLGEYLHVRQRKLSLLDSIIPSILSVTGTPYSRMQLLIGVDDSSNTANIQYNELRYLEKRLGPGTAIMAGLDSLARLLIGRCAQEEYGYQVKAAVRYVGGTEGRPSSEFDLYTLEEVVKLHLDFFRAEQVPEEEAELCFLVMTAPADPAQAEEYREELLSALESNLAKHIPTVLDEASNNAYGDALEQALLERIPFAGLIAYAGKYDQANVTGAAFAMGFSRYLYLRCRTENEKFAQIAQVKQMANSMALTEYILHTRTPLNQYVEALGVNRNNMLSGTTRARLIQQKLEELFSVECRKVRENLLGTALPVRLDPWTEQEITKVSITGPYFPWKRTFEISFTVRAALRAVKSR